MAGAAGGAPLSTSSLARALRVRGIDSSAYCLDVGIPSERAALAASMAGHVEFGPLFLWHRKLRSAPWKRPGLLALQLWRTGFLARSIGRVVEFARNERVDIVHSNTLMTLEGGFAARRLGVPHVWHVRELVGPGAPFRFPVEGPALSRLMPHLADVVIANSRATYDALEGWVPANRLRLVWNGIDLAPFESVLPPRRTSKVVVAMVGSTNSHWKKHALFIAACARVSIAEEVEFRVYGHHHPDVDPYARDLVALARRVPGGIRFEGFVSNPVEIMSQIDVLVHPASDESFGRVVVEAMAAGRPVVGVSGGGVDAIFREVRQPVGDLVPPDDPDALASAISRLVRDRPRATALGDNGRAEARRAFSIDSHAEAIVAVYEEAREAHSRRRRSRMTGLHE
ncbi:MAG: glycosyltransferase family 4 protein [Sandaracinus sp.]